MQRNVSPLLIRQSNRYYFNFLLERGGEIQSMHHIAISIRVRESYRPISDVVEELPIDCDFDIDILDHKK